MKFEFEARPSDSPLVEAIWRTQSAGSGQFTSLAEARWEMVVTRQRGQVRLTLRGPETKAALAPVPEEAEFFGVIFKLGTFMPPLPGQQLADTEINLPAASPSAFWLHGAAWEFPTFDNADVFIQRLTRTELLQRDEVVEAALREQRLALSARSVQRRFLYVTGLTHTTIRQIARARQALTLLQQGVPILDTVEQAGYFDQPHLTRALKHFMGQTPAQIGRSEPLSF